MNANRAAALTAAALAMACTSGGGPTLTVEVTSPAGTVHVRQEVVTFQFTVAGGTPDRVELLRDGVLFAELPLPYQYEWPTNAEAEGSYQFVARARLGDRSFDSRSTTVVVDRTAPASLSPAVVPNARASGPFYVVTSEPVLPIVGSVQLTTEAGAPIPFVAIASGNSIGAYPSDPVAAPARVRLQLTRVTDLAGNPLPATQVLFEVPTWRQRETWFQVPILNPPDPSVAIVGDVVAFSWANRLVRCQSGVCLSATTLVDSLSLVMTSAGQLLAASADGFDPVVISEWTHTGLTARGEPFRAAGYKSGLALGARAVADGEHDAIVTWHYGTGTPTDTLVVNAARLTNGIWKNLGRVAGGSGEVNWAWSGSAAIAPNGTLYAATVGNYDDGGAGSSRVEVRKWNGANWILLGTPRGKDAISPSLVVDASGTPCVAYTELGFGYGVIQVDRWSGSAWQGLDVVSVAATEHAYAPSLAIDKANAPVLAFTSSAAGAEAEMRGWVRRWSGSDWTDVGGALNVATPTRAARSPRLATDSSGNVAVTFFEWTGDGVLFSEPPTATWELRLVELNR